MIKENLKKLNIELLSPVSPLANYVSCNQVGNILFLSGQISVNSEFNYIGKATKNSSIEELQKAAKISCLNILNQLNGFLNGDLEKIKKCLKISVFINSEPNFTDQHLVANGCSDLLVEIFGVEKGKHTRSAVGVASLPKNATVEIESIFELNN